MARRRDLGRESAAGVAPCGGEAEAWPRGDGMACSRGQAYAIGPGGVAWLAGQPTATRLCREGSLIEALMTDRRAQEIDSINWGAAANNRKGK